MAVQLQQAIAVGKYLVSQRLMGNKRFPLVRRSSSIDSWRRTSVASSDRSDCGRADPAEEIYLSLHQWLIAREKPQ